MGDLRHSLYEDWPIFNISPSDIQEFLYELAKGSEDFRLELFSGLVGIPQVQDANEGLRLLHNGTWSDFVNSIQHQNRFFSDAINLDLLKKFIRRTARKQELPQTFFRCRINDQKLEYTEMGAPPAKISSSGRLNPEGISVLYLSDNKDVCIQEVRAVFNDSINFAQFRIKEKLNLVDLIKFEEKAFNRSDEEDDDVLIAYYLNRDILKEISKEFAKPSNNSSKIMNYLPLQFISEFIKSQGYQGILYSSVMDKNATNLVLFDEKFAIIDKTIEYKQITKIGYSHENLS